MKNKNVLVLLFLITILAAISSAIFTEQSTLCNDISLKEATTVALNTINDDNWFVGKWSSLRGFNNIGKVKLNVYYDPNGDCVEASIEASRGRFSCHDYNKPPVNKPPSSNPPNGLRAR